jgi:hypothetical protein
VEIKFTVFIFIERCYNYNIEKIEEGNVIMEKQEQIELAAKLLSLPVKMIEGNCSIIEENGALYFSQAFDESGARIRGGDSIIIDKDGTVLYANSSIGYTEHLREFKNGRRTPLESFHTN